MGRGTVADFGLPVMVRVRAALYAASQRLSSRALAREAERAQALLAGA